MIQGSRVVREPDKLSESGWWCCCPLCTTHVQIQIWRACQWGCSCHCGVGCELGAASVPVFQYLEHQRGKQCEGDWKRSCENSLVVLDGKRMPNVCWNAMAFAICPGERFHESMITLQSDWRTPKIILKWEKACNEAFMSLQLRCSCT